MMRTLLIALVAAMACAACTIAPDGSPRDVAADERNLLPADAFGAAGATGSSRIYLVTPSEPGQQRQLRSAKRDVQPRPDPVVRALLAGPSRAELDDRLSSMIPAGTSLLSTRASGSTLFVDVSDEITGLTGDDLVLAVAQIVFTATEIEGIESVRLRVNGADLAWPQGDRQTRRGDLRVYDYPGLVESSQPAYPAVQAAT